MILSIVGYGDPVLRKVGAEISPEYPNLSELIANMYDTMYNAYGVGLAAPQIGLAIRLFIVDTAPFSESDDLSSEEAQQLKGFKKTFIVILCRLVSPLYYEKIHFSSFYTIVTFCFSAAQTSKSR